jgi:hypothetical protein
MSGARGPTDGAGASAMGNVLAGGVSTSPTGAVVVAIGDVTTSGVVARATTVDGLRGGSAGRARAVVDSPGGNCFVGDVDLAVDLLAPALRSSTGAGACRKTVSCLKSSPSHPPWLDCGVERLRTLSLTLGPGGSGVRAAFAEMTT